jgi:hypothetical protein
VERVNLLEVIVNQVVDLLLPLGDVLVSVFYAPIVKLKNLLEIIWSFKSLAIPVQKQLEMVRHTLAKVVEHFFQV